MDHHLNVMVAQSAARERERDLQLRIRQQQAVAARSAPSTAVYRHPRLHAVLARLHMAHA